MLEYLQDYKGNLTVDGVTYNSVSDLATQLGSESRKITMMINTKNEKQAPVNEVKKEEKHEEATLSTKIYAIKVRQYMTKPGSPAFDFMIKYNHNVPMPMRQMVGKILEETRGMVKMELHAEILQEITTVCMHCGRPLTNPVSQYFGVGPECGGHGYVNPFSSDEELRVAVAGYKKKLAEVKWTGWIIKSSLEEMKVIREELL
jgi:hypothetical protein